MRTRALAILGLAIPSALMASLESGRASFEARMWPEAMDAFLQTLDKDPGNEEAHAYVTLTARHMEADRQALLRGQRLALLQDAARLAENRQADMSLIEEAYRETSQGGWLDRERAWRARCEEARLASASGQLLSAHAMVLQVIGENSAFAPAQVELSELQSKTRAKLESQDALSISERYALEGFYAYGQADYTAALSAWSKLRTLLTQSFPAAESARRIQDLRFAPFETVAHAHVSEEKNKRARRALYEQGVSLYQQGQFTRALDQFRQLAIQDPEYPQLGHYLVQTEAAIEKERLARLGNAKQREIAEALRTGLAALEKQRFQEAQLSFERIVHLDPSHGEAHAYLDMVKVERKRQHDPHAAHRHYEAGLVAYASGKLDEARREWRIALRMNTQHEKARLALGKVEKELAFHVAQDKNDGPLP